MGSISDEAIHFFKVSNICTCTMAMGLIQPLTIKCQESFWGVMCIQRAMLTTSPPSVNYLENVGSSMCHNPMGLSGLLQGYLHFLHAVHAKYTLQELQLYRLDGSWQ
jgi:hypothetical protein